jgi:hypothetical protein
MITKIDIIESAHLQKSSEMARTYFKDQGLVIESITIEQCEILSKYIQKEIDTLLADKSYKMIADLKMHPKIVKDDSGISLFARGYYFSRRQAISFEYKNQFIGFCGWASGCNRIPFIKGFVDWCDYMKNNSETD